MSLRMLAAGKSPPKLAVGVLAWPPGRCDSVGLIRPDSNTPPRQAMPAKPDGLVRNDSLGTKMKTDGRK